MSIELRNVRRTYGHGANAVHALRELSVTIETGALTAIVGPSGSGKSTLLNLLGALDQASSGTVIVAGRDVTNLDDNARTRLRREKIGFVFQFFNLLPTMTARENVLLPARLCNVSDKGNRQRADQLLAQVGLAGRAHHRPDQLSGGEMQRVAICRALVMDPPVVLADEPTGNLDSGTGKEMMRLLRNTVSPNRTVVLVTHDPRIAQMADRVLTLRDGKLIGDHAPHAQNVDEAFGQSPEQPVSGWNTIVAAAQDTQNTDCAG